MGTEKQRKQIINKINNTIKTATEAQKAISKKKLIAQVCIEHGVTKNKATEYLQLLLDAEIITEKNNELWTKDA